MINASQTFLDWTEIESLCRDLAEMLRPFGPFTGIAAITRGGLAPALMVSQHLDIRLIETIGLQTYHNRTVDRPTWVKEPSPRMGDGTGWLVIDDLSDTGTTLNFIRPVLPKAIFAALYAKPAGKHLLDHYVSEVEQGLWLVFPWEKD
jgi:xanthine phosphoribosyltransferase